MSEPRCDNCLNLGDIEPDPSSDFAEVELLKLRTMGGTVGWEVADVEIWCARCITGSALLGATKIAGRATYGTDRPHGEKPMRVRIV